MTIEEEWEDAGIPLVGISRFILIMEVEKRIRWWIRLHEEMASAILKWLANLNNAQVLLTTMQFQIQKKQNENIHRYPTDDLKIAQRFAQELKNELGDFLLTVALFGSQARREASSTSDIDVLVVADDASFQMTDALIEGYRLIVEKLVMGISTKLHITSMTFTSFWEYAKVGDPVIINVLRDGVPLVDAGFFEPLQRLLHMGKIRPSEESIWRYFGRSPMTLLNSRWHVLQASLDLYWAVIDAAHAALMRKGEMPPTPGHVADILERVYVKPRLLEKRYAETMRKFYLLSKQITHREIKGITGEEYEKLYREADDFVKRMKKLVETRSF